MPTKSALTTHDLVDRERAHVICLHGGQNIVERLKGGDDVAEPEIWLDFAGLTAVSSAELSALIRFTLGMRQLGKSVFACNVGEDLEDLFSITRLPLERI